MSTVSFSCDNIFPSGCVIYTGEVPEFIHVEDSPEPDPELPYSIPCNASLDDLLSVYGIAIDDILESIDITGLTPLCFSFNPATVTIPELFQEEIDKTCDNQDRINTIQEELSSLNIGIKTIDIDLDCLAPLAAPCVGEESPTLLTILTVLRAEICALKAQLAECLSNGCGGSGNCTSGTSGVNGLDGTSGTSASGGGTSGTSGTNGTSGTSASC